ncbi:unnamed protein product [Sympodiomycopsis kandeliae]
MVSNILGMDTTWLLIAVLYIGIGVIIWCQIREYQRSVRLAKLEYDREELKYQRDFQIKKLTYQTLKNAVGDGKAL